MSNVKITIVGTGAIGTSLALALKQTDDPPRLIAHDKDPLHTRQALKMGAFDKSEWNLINACDDADLIVLALPADAVRPTLKAIAGDLKPDVVITDTLSTKADILQAATELLPPTAHFVGGHPIVLPGGSGPEHARADLFQNALYCLTPAPNVAPEAVQLVDNLVSLVGGTPFYLDPLEHDGLVSTVNDLPLLLSLALVNNAGQSPTWKETRKLAGNTFAQISAGAAMDASTLTAMLWANRSNLAQRIESIIGTLKQAQSLLAADDVAAFETFVNNAVTTRAAWLADFEGNKLSNLYEKPVETVQKENMLKQLLTFGRWRK